MEQDRFAFRARRFAFYTIWVPIIGILGIDFFDLVDRARELYWIIFLILFMAEISALAVAQSVITWSWIRRNLHKRFGPPRQIRPPIKRKAA